MIVYVTINKIKKMCTSSCLSSVTKKYLMSLSGAVLVLFVLGHMLGNLQMFIGPDLMNAYAHKLQSLPYGLLWIIRLFLLLCTGTHILMAILLTIENNAARSEKYRIKKRVQATLASATMGISGSVLLFFIVFHLLHFTVRSIFPEYQTFVTLLEGREVPDVYKMVIVGFSKTTVSVFYIFAMAILCMHLSHGVTSMFQSIGWRNKKWKPFLDQFALIYGWVIFLGFSSIPIAVLISKFTQFKIFTF